MKSPAALPLERMRVTRVTSAKHDRTAKTTAPIGARLRAARKTKGYTIEQVAQSSGLDKSFISRLERDATSISVASLVRVCDALGLRPGELFEPPKTNLVREKEAPKVNFGGENVQEFLLSQGLGGELMVLRSVIEAGGHGGDEPYVLDTEVSFVTVVSNSLEIILEDAHYFLNAGDSMTFSSRVPHNWRNPTDSPTTVLWITTPHP